MISKDNEIELYHKICDISNACREYFYFRKHLPDYYWSIDEVVQLIYSLSVDLKKKYNDLKKENK